MNFPLIVTLVAACFVAVVAALVVLKRKKPELFAHVVALLRRKKQAPAVAASNAAAVPPAAVPSPATAGNAAPAASDTAAPSADGGTIPYRIDVTTIGDSQPRYIEEPPAPVAQPSQEIAPMPPLPDKGIVTAAALLAGWQLPDGDTPGQYAKRHADLMYLAQMTRQPGGNRVFEDVIIGNQGEINVCRNYPHTIGNDGLFDEDGHPHDWRNDGRVAADIKAEVTASIAAESARMAARGRPLPTHDFSRYRLPHGTQIPSPRG